MSAELQNVFQCADQLLCLSLRNAVALAVIHQISQDPAWTVWESHPAANCWEGKGREGQTNMRNIPSTNIRLGLECYKLFYEDYKWDILSFKLRFWDLW